MPRIYHSAGSLNYARLEAKVCRLEGDKGLDLAILPGRTGGWKELILHLNAEQAYDLGRQLVHAFEVVPAKDEPPVMIEGEL